ncbi:MAG TPA: class I adenylate-forming enzyme family protein [Candidatus Margulisiibacteriota bacterium]|nr:class I adenylate-forming enzyme family protein [Candidatus Margulisiibacteriota bacterium]
MKVAELLLKRAQETPQKPALIFKEKKITFEQLKSYSFRLASGLVQLGIGRGDKIAIYLPNCPEYLFSYLAAWCCGVTVVPLDFMLTDEELSSCISHSEARILITKDKTGVSLEKIKERCPSLEHVLLCRERKEGFLSFEDLLDKGEERLIPVEIQDKDYAIIFYTSGTTGRPKGVLVNYLQLGAPPKSMEFFVDLNAKDIILCALPLSHLGGLVYLQNNITYGITMVLMERFVPLEFLKNIQNYKITCFWLVPSMYYAILQLKEFESLDLSSLRWLVSFGASSSPEALRRFHQYCSHAHFLNGWGLTETNAPTVVLKMGSKKIESIGRPAPWIEVKVFDEGERELPQGEVGEIVVRGWVVTDGYYKDPEATRSVMRNGWFHTGDLGKFDRDGDLYIVGRKKEMIKVSGEIVFEPEVEAAIHRHPDVAEVAVIGVADKLRGEVPKAFVVLREGGSLDTETLRFFCREHLAHFKIPHYFEFSETLPKNRSGKIDKEALRKNLAYK